jgi:pimeloyl-ACP methyl ester carboxylesterase
MMRWFLLMMVVANSHTGNSQVPKFSGSIELNGLETYYEVHGNGSPLFLLHGFTQSSKYWFPLLDSYTGEFEVYLVDLLGHGRSSPFRSVVSVREVAENLRDLVEYLGLEKIDAIGYSYGGETLIQLALIEPALIRSMVITGSCGSWRAEDFPEFVEYLSYDNIANLPWMQEQQMNDERIRNILEQVPNYSVMVSESEFSRIVTKTLFVVGDSDPATPLECIVDAKTNMPDASLWVVPNTGHSILRSEYRDHFIKISKEFLSPTSE